MAKFTDFELPASLLDAITTQGWSEPTPIQQKAIPIILEGRDLLAIAQTGSGKTGAFVLPILAGLSQNQSLLETKNPRVLILAPTRELALQLHQTVEMFAAPLGAKSVLLIGGASEVVQKNALALSPNIVVATPGRLLDHLRQGNLTFTPVDGR